MRVNVGASIAYPLRDPKWATKIFFGIGMMMLACCCGWTANFFCSLGKVGSVAGVPLALASSIGMVLVSLMMSGYLMRTLHELLTGKEGMLPTWSQPGDLLKKGLGMWIIDVVYGLIPGLLLMFGLRTVFASMFASAGVHHGMTAVTHGAMTFAGVGVGFLIGGVGFLSVLVVAFLSPMVMVRYASTLSIAHALSPREVVKDIRRNTKGYAFVLTMVFLMHLGAGTILSLVPLVGPWLYAAGSFFLNLVGLHMLSQHQRTIS